MLVDESLTDYPEPYSHTSPAAPGACRSTSCGHPGKGDIRL